MSLRLQLRQPSLLDDCPVAAAVATLANSGSVDQRGAVFTRKEVVDFVLDLVGYTADQPLVRMSLLEPAFGAGDFLLPAVDRLLAVWRRTGVAATALADLSGCIRAVELHGVTFQQTQQALIGRLRAAGIPLGAARGLTDRWLIQSDFLLAELPDAFDVVVGNPPYVRQELIPADLLAEYRQRYSTIYDRADLYVPFIERSLRSLGAGGVLGFICSDRWMKNKYGGPLRALVADGFHLRAHVDMTDTDAFHSDVIAYPAISIVARTAGGSTRMAVRPPIDAISLKELADQLLSSAPPAADGPVKELVGVASGSEPWLLDATDQWQIVRRLEGRFPLLEEAGCRVGIGVATGADKAFIAPFEELDVEDSRKQPLVTTRDLRDGTVQWSGLGVVNPFDEGGGLVDLAAYPRLRRYLESRKAEIAGRHCARKSPAGWYRTIDRITPSLTRTPKLLIPDIKGHAHVVHEEGRLYPHHNLYFVTSGEWDLRALQAVLLSKVARAFVVAYSTRMRGGYLRFQAQYLRRIRLPLWRDVSPDLRQRLTAAGKDRELAACDCVAAELYGLTAAEAASLGV